MKIKQCALLALVAGIHTTTWAYDSGSTGSDGALTPVVDTEIALPADGVFNYTTVNIPAGVTVTFTKNAANTPVTLLTSGDVTIAGTIDVSGGKSPDAGSAGDGNTGDDGIPGVGGPGGFDGGQSGIPGDILGSAGLGPGGGVASTGTITTSTFAGRGCGGEGGAYAGSGGNSGAVASSSPTVCDVGDIALGSLPYGSAALLPLIGGSGGGGASSGAAFSGSGGGGGGGALLIASSGVVNITGAIKANGGASGASNGSQAGGSGGGGAGGAIRIIATTISGDGPITASGGARGAAFGVIRFGSYSNGGNGSAGRIRLEAETFTRTATTSPAFSFAQPQEKFLAGMPALRISKVAGVDAPVVPTGSADIVLPEATPNPVTVEFATSGVPLGNTVTLRVIPARGTTVSAISGALSGSEANATASTTVALPDGPSTLAAEVSYTVTVAMGESLSRFTDGEMVASVRLTHDAVKGAQTMLITVSGKEFVMPSLMPVFPA